MKHILKKSITILCSIQFAINLAPQSAFAQNPSGASSASNERSSSQKQEDDLLKQLDYPELMVVPRATDRLNMEIQNENNMSVFTLWPYQVSALGTLSSGLLQKGKYKQETPTEQQKKDSDDASLAAIGIGGGWLGLSLFYTLRRPYASSLPQIRAIKGSDKKSELMRERLAEEALENPAHVVNSLTYLSVGSNLAASIYVLSFSRQDQRVLPALSALLSFTPLIFQSRYSTSYNKHLEYKKKIYAPIFGYGVDHKLRPQFQVSLNF